MFRVSGELRLSELHELIHYIYDRTGYYDYFRLCRGAKGERPMICCVSGSGLCGRQLQQFVDFMRYIEQLKKNQIDFGEAVMPENDKGRVRIMSIHR
ncbi:MAG: hypothetical protein ACLUI7_06675 [Coprococcus sp.]